MTLDANVNVRDGIGMNDVPARVPLLDFGGVPPPAQDWFIAALAVTPTRDRIEVEGAGIELLTWGERGRPGLLFLHGNGAHADWWSFIAPFFAAEYRVAALSWSGMGGSDHRARYTIEHYLAEIFGGAEAAGLFEAGKPHIVGHSFGGFPMMAAAAGPGGARFRSTTIVDTPFRGSDEPGEAPSNATARPHRIYPTLAAALARFRFAPVQECANLFIADHIARGSLIEVPTETGCGWTWRFDPYVWSRFTVAKVPSLLTGPRCPAALIWGERSALMPPGKVAQLRTALPEGSPALAIPDADHHVMVDQPLAFVAALRGLFAGWP